MDFSAEGRPRAASPPPSLPSMEERRRARIRRASCDAEQAHAHSREAEARGRKRAKNSAAKDKLAGSTLLSTLDSEVAEDFEAWTQTYGHDVNSECLSEWRSSTEFEQTKLERLAEKCTLAGECERGCVCTYDGSALEPQIPGMNCDATDIDHDDVLADYGSFPHHWRPHCADAPTIPQPGSRCLDCGKFIDCKAENGEDYCISCYHYRCEELGI